MSKEIVFTGYGVTNRGRLSEGALCKLWKALLTREKYKLDAAPKDKPYDRAKPDPTGKHKFVLSVMKPGRVYTKREMLARCKANGQDFPRTTFRGMVASMEANGLIEKVPPSTSVKIGLYQLAVMTAPAD